MFGFLNLKGILKFLTTPIGILVVAFIIIQIQSGRIDSLKDDLSQLKADIALEQTINAALKDTIRTLGDYKPLPESIMVEIPVPIEVPIPGAEMNDSAGEPYVAFYDRSHWEKWYRKNCTGIIEFDTTQIWDNGKGARAQGRFYYGLGTAARNWILITPAGDWSVESRKEGLRGGIEWLISTTGDLSIGGDLTWRKWGPAARIDIAKNSQPAIWLGVRRDF